MWEWLGWQGTWNGLINIFRLGFIDSKAVFPNFKIIFFSHVVPECKLTIQNFWANVTQQIKENSFHITI